MKYSLFLLAASLQTLAAADLAVPGVWNLQAALDAAQPGDTITIQAGSTQRGNYVLRARPGVLPITVRTSAYASLPARRIRPADSALLAKIISPNVAPALQALPGSARWRFVGLELSADVYAYSVVEIGSSESIAADVPSDFDFHQVYVHGHSTLSSKRGIQLNGTRITVRNSHISGFRSASQEAQALAGWNGPGTIDIYNNYLEATAMPVLWGGARATLDNVVPSNIRVVGNLISRPLAWQGVEPAVKNLFELKNASNVLLEGNILENNWAAAQSGRAILFTVRTEGTMCWATVKNVNMVNNIIRNVTAAVSIHGYDNYTYPGSSASCTGSVSDISIRNNLFLNVGPLPTSKWGTGPMFEIINGPKRIWIEQNTGFQSQNIMTVGGVAATEMRLVNNIFPHGTYGVFGDSVGVGNPALAVYAPGSSVTGNVLIGGLAAWYPSGNFFPATASQVGFTNEAGGDYSLGTSSPYRNAGSGGKDPGVDMAALRAATANAESGNLAAVTGAYSLTVTQGSNGAVAAAWAAPRGDVSDWIGVFVAGAATNASPEARVMTGGNATGTANWATLAAGRELRYVRSDGSTAATATVGGAATEGNGGGGVPVTPVSLQVSMAVTPAATTPRGNVTVTWSTTAGTPLAADRIAIYIRGNTSTTPVWTRRTFGAASGSMTFAAPTLVGTYDVQYQSNTKMVKAVTLTVRR